MPSYDPDLIAALAEGTLDPETAAAAERRIASDPQAAAELAAQRAAIAVWGDAKLPELTRSESSALRDTVAAALHLHPDTSAATTRRHRTPWTTIAIAAATVVAAAVVLPLTLFTRDQAVTTQDLAAEAATTTAVSARDEEQTDDDLLTGAAPEAAEAPAVTDLTAETNVSTTAAAGYDSESDWAYLTDYLLTNEESLLDAADPDLDTCRPEAIGFLEETSLSGAEMDWTSGTVIVWFTYADGIEDLIIFDPVDCTMVAEHH